LVWSPAFRRSGPAKAGTPNGRFMESPLSFFLMHWDHEPTPNPSQEGRDRTRTNACSPLGRGRGWVGSGKEFAYGLIAFTANAPPSRRPVGEFHVQQFQTRRPDGRSAPHVSLAGTIFGFAENVASESGTIPLRGKRQMPRTKFNRRWTQMNADERRLRPA